MGYLLSKDQFGEAMRQLGKTYRIFAPVCKKGEGRFKDVDLVRYDFVSDASEIELTVESDYAFKEFMLPLSETLFFFTENQVKEADIDERPVIVFLRSCDMHAVKRLDHMYLENGSEEDWFYRRRRDLVKFALIGCSKSFDDCFCVDMGTNRTEDGYVFSVDESEGMFRCDTPDPAFAEAFAKAGGTEADVEPWCVTENQKAVTVPEDIPLSIYSDELWDEYTKRCVNCGRCTIVCQDQRRAHAFQSAPQDSRLPGAHGLRHVRGLRPLRHGMSGVHFILEYYQQGCGCSREGGWR